MGSFFRLCEPPRPKSLPVVICIGDAVLAGLVCSPGSEREPVQKGPAFYPGVLRLPAPHPFLTLFCFLGLDFPFRKLRLEQIDF